jgi:hypothetical protein
VLAVLLVPLVPIAALLLLLGAERLEHGLQDSDLSGFARSQSALAGAVDRSRDESA